MKKLTALLLALALALPCAARSGDGFVPEAEASAPSAAAPAPAPATTTFTNRVGAAWFPTVPSLAFIFVAIVQGLALEDDEQIKYSFSPVMSLEGLYSFNSRISAGVDVGYFTSSYVITKKETNEFVKKGSYIDLLTVMPEFRYNYLDREKVKLYGSVEAGVMMVLSGDFQVNFSAQLNPIGVEFGDTNFFGFTELGLGMNYFGARAGIGYRF